MITLDVSYYVSWGGYKFIPDFQNLGPLKFCI